MNIYLDHFHCALQMHNIDEYGNDSHTRSNMHSLQSYRRCRCSRGCRRCLQLLIVFTVSGNQAIDEKNAIDISRNEEFLVIMFICYRRFFFVCVLFLLLRIISSSFIRLIRCVKNLTCSFTDKFITL